MLDKVSDYMTTLRERLDNNLVSPVRHMTLQQWIRVVVIVCGYLLLRPYIVKLGSKKAMEGFEAASRDGSEKAKGKGKGKLGSNDLRNMVNIPEDTDSEGDEYGADDVAGANREGGKTTAANVKASEWGTKARRRQRRVIKEILETEENRIQEMLGDDEDKDIAEFLED